MNGAKPTGGGGPTHPTRITVESKGDFFERFGAELAGGRVFIPHESPPGVGAELVVDFFLPTGQPLCRIKGRVAHAKVATVKGDRTAGVDLQLTGADPVARQIIENARSLGTQGGPALRPTTGKLEAAHRVDDLSAGGRGDGPIIGIDLGTTNSCVAVVENGKPRIIPTAEGYETLPSVLFLTPQKKLLVGHKALEMMTRFPDRAIYGSKRFIGRPFASSEVKTYGHFFRYGFVAGKGGLVAAQIGGVVVPLETAAAYILAHLRNVAQKHLGVPIRRAVITVPAYFGERQRQAVTEAARLAGLELERLINEPTAGAVAYGYGRGLKRTILVYDLGGGTFDASILRIDGDRMEVLATDGDAFLGGSDFDDRLTEYVVSRIEREHQVSLRDNPVAMNRVRIAAELAKCQLSDAPSIKIQLPFLAEAETGQLTVDLQLERGLLESLTQDLVQRTLVIVQNTLDAAKLRVADLNEVVMIGGQSRSPLVRQLLQERFGKAPARNVHPDHAVALGAALVGAAAHRQAPVMLTDVLPASIRLAEPDGAARPLLSRGQPLPARTDFTVQTTAGQQGAEFRVELYRGEGSRAQENEPIGMVRLTSSVALSIAKREATVSLEVNEQGLLEIAMKHPMTGQTQALALELDFQPTTGEVLEAGAAEMATA